MPAGSNRADFIVANREIAPGADVILVGAGFESDLDGLDARREGAGIHTRHVKLQLGIRRIVNRIRQQHVDSLTICAE